MFPPISGNAHERDSNSAVRYRRLVEEWKKRYARAKKRADTIRAQSQRRSNVELANEIDSAQPREKEAEKSFDEVEELFSMPKKVKSRVSNIAPTQRMDRLLHRAMEGTHVRRMRTLSRDLKTPEDVKVSSSPTNNSPALVANTASTSAPTASVNSNGTFSRSIADSRRRRSRGSLSNPHYDEISRQADSYVANLSQKLGQMAKEARGSKQPEVNTSPRKKKASNVRIRPKKEAHTKPDKTIPQTRTKVGETELERKSPKEAKPAASTSSVHPARTPSIVVGDAPGRTAAAKVSKMDPTPSETFSKDASRYTSGEAAKKRRFPEGTDIRRLSKVERFFFDEELRHRKRIEREKKQQLRNEYKPQTTDDVRESAKKIWTRMQKDVETRWTQYRRDNPASTTEELPPEGRNTEDERTKGSNVYSHINTIAHKYARMPVRDLKMALRSLGIRETQMQVVEKVELVRILQNAMQKRDDEQTQKLKAQAEAEEQDRIRRAIVDDVDRWRRNRSIRWLLNSINDASSGSALYLPPYASLTAIRKVYKRSLLKIHPDKHTHCSLAERWRAEETFKAVNEIYTKFCKLQGTR